MAKKLGICLGAGGARGIAHIGFLQALTDNDIEIDVITGCSMGSIVGSMYLLGYTPEEMKKIACDVTKNDLIDVTVNLLKGKAILKAQKLERLLDAFYKSKTFDNLKKPFACIATDLYSGEIVKFDSGLIKTAVRASVSIPFVFPPVEYGDKLLVDGGLSNKIPVKEARELGADVVVAVDVLDEIPESDKINSIVSVALRSLDIMCANIDRTAFSGEKPDLLLIPELGKVSQFVIGNQRFCYDRGYELGMKNAEKIKELIS
ncbi:MAG: patatin-like phospholipase family protein [Christensenellaceae bacterium]